MLYKPIGIMFKLSICKVLKYYPIGFIISYDPIIYDIPSLSELCSSNIDDEAYLQFPLIYFQEPRWPVCASSGYHYILSRSEESSVYGTYTE